MDVVGITSTWVQYFFLMFYMVFCTDLIEEKYIIDVQHQIFQVPLKKTL